MALTDFKHGVFYAAAIVVEVHNDPTIAATIIQNAGFAEHDVSELDESDKKQLRKLNNYDGINLKGL
ncbi:hypothetical protein [Thalassotalea marina]|uniref:Uncharacterized protein n=1 Tax=Thalassotalea marina TaxID=1673741 RepID=A0A919BT28_9GAMM|nr:hypothetical protein [Thalassotalea marina]GHG07822.1 hypothetical protein GCM10017161_41970 [Thalassotalea marina]